MYSNLKKPLNANPQPWNDFSAKIIYCSDGRGGAHTLCEQLLFNIFIAVFAYARHPSQHERNVYRILYEQ
jgi:hypothetical protein